MIILQLLKILWTRWKAFAHVVATFQSRVILFVFYYIVLAPFALGMQLASDPLGLRSGAPGGWLARPTPGDDRTLTARRQF